MMLISVMGEIRSERESRWEPVATREGNAGRRSVSWVAVKELRTEGPQNLQKNTRSQAKGFRGAPPRQTIFMSATGGTGAWKQTNGQQQARVLRWHLS